MGVPPDPVTGKFVTLALILSTSEPLGKSLPEARREIRMRF